MSFRGREDTLPVKDLFPEFKKTREGQGALLRLADCQVTLIQSDQYVAIEYFGGTYLGSWY